MFAPGYEKRFYEGVQAYLSGDLQKALIAFESASSGDERNASDDLFAGVVAHKFGDNDKAISYLEKVVASVVELPDELMAKYLPASIAEISLSIDITPTVKATVPASSLGACLLLAEIYQERGSLEEAIGLLQQLSVDASNEIALKVALCDLLFEDGDADGVIEASADLENDSDLALAGLVLRGKALAQLGLADAACAVFTSGLKKTAGRDKGLLTEVRYERAAVYAASGKASQAKRDFERIYADNPSYRDVAARLDIGTETRPPRDSQTHAAKSASSGNIAELGEKLRTLTSLRDEGLITPDEFESKRKLLLSDGREPD